MARVWFSINSYSERRADPLQCRLLGQHQRNHPPSVSISELRTVLSHDRHALCDGYTIGIARPHREAVGVADRAGKYLVIRHGLLP